MVQETSKEAYYGEVKPTLTRRHKEVLSIFKRHDILAVTNNELARELGWPINTVTPRVFELREMKILIEAHKRPCTITKRKVIAWRLAPEQGKLL